MYANKMAVAIKTNGKILREFKDTVYLPFGSEYSILLKNLHSQRALVNVFIDGTNIVEGGLVLLAGQEVNLERSIANGNLNVGNKLKFIERTGAIEQSSRGIKLEDGLVRVEWQYEMPRPVINTAYDNFRFTGISGMGKTYTSASYNVNGTMRSVDFSAGESMKAQATSATNATLQSMNISATSAHEGMATMDSYMSQNDVGITVPGSRSDQKFQTTTIGALELEKHTIVLKLLGETPDNKPITESITVKKKSKCTTCDKLNKATAKFCGECGTSLEIFA